MRRLVVLRPEPGAGATVAAATSAGLEAVAMPLFEIAPVAWDAPDPNRFDGLLITSANALRHGGAGARRAARAGGLCGRRGDGARRRGSAGFVVSFVGDGGVADLLAAIDPACACSICAASIASSRRRRARRSPICPSIARSRSTCPASPQSTGAVVAVHSPRAGARLAELAALGRLDISTTAIAAISPQAAPGGG